MRHSERRASSRSERQVATKRPTPAERVAYFASAVVVALIVGLAARAQAWDRGVTALAMLVAAGLFGAIATPLLLGRKVRT